MQRRDSAALPAGGPRRSMAATVLALLVGCGSGPSPIAPASDGGGDDDAAVVPIDAQVAIDAAPPPIDANLEPPPPPTLGAQLHRAGRPAIRTMLLGTFATPAVKASLNDVYDRASDPSTWKTLMLPNGVTLESEFDSNLAWFDGLDRGRGTTGAGCGNAMHYDGPAGPRSYAFMADLLADDQLYLDSSKPTCDIYFDGELDRAVNFPATTCGGRMPTHDVVDMTYSVLAGGAFGLQKTGRIPNFHDNVAAHADLSTTFPFLGAPH
jgi:Domain of unknown function (DUF4331)